MRVVGSQCDYLFCPPRMLGRPPFRLEKSYFKIGVLYVNLHLFINWWWLFLYEIWFKCSTSTQRRLIYSIVVYLGAPIDQMVHMFNEPYFFAILASSWFLLCLLQHLRFWLFWSSTRPLLFPCESSSFYHSSTPSFIAIKVMLSMYTKLFQFLFLWNIPIFCSFALPFLYFFYFI